MASPPAGEGRTMIISRADARARGLKRYYTEPCPHGHIAERMVSSNECVVCNQERQQQWRAENPEKHRQRALRYYNEKGGRERQRERRAENAPLYREQDRQ